MAGPQSLSSPGPVYSPAGAYAQGVIEPLLAQATPAELQAADIAAERTLAAVQQAIDGRAAFPPWPAGGLPVEDSLPVIKDALAAGHTLELLYYAASTDTLTHRRVEPYRLEWHGPESQTPYLIGFCHHAQAERMFRLDRIRQIAIAQQTEDGDSESDSEMRSWTELL
ncbi:MAG: WYL domain-containing protein [Chloroflexota bacterium]